MSNPTPNSGDIFELRKIRRLVALMNEHDLSEIDLCKGDTRIRLRRQRDSGTVTANYAPLPPPAAAPASPAAEPAPAAAPVDEAHVFVVTSPMVGTFYAASSPDSPPYVKVGDHVGPDTTVCVVEAMKVFNEIPAGSAGKIIAVLVDNGEPVEFGQPLFKIDTRQ